MKAKEAKKTIASEGASWGMPEDFIKSLRTRDYNSATYQIHCEAEGQAYRILVGETAHARLRGEGADDSVLVELAVRQLYEVVKAGPPGMVVDHLARRQHGP